MSVRVYCSPKAKPSWYRYGLQVGRAAAIVVSPGYLLLRWGRNTWRYVPQSIRYAGIAAGWHRSEW